MRWFGWFRRTPESEYARGYREALKFLASKLGQQNSQRLAYWSSACADQEFDTDGGHYAKGSKAAFKDAGIDHRKLHE